MSIQTDFDSETVDAPDEGVFFVAETEPIEDTLTARSVDFFETQAAHMKNHRATVVQLESNPQTGAYASAAARYASEREKFEALGIEELGQPHLMQTLTFDGSSVDGENRLFDVFTWKLTEVYQVLEERRPERVVEKPGGGGKEHQPQVLGLARVGRSEFDLKVSNLGDINITKTDYDSLGSASKPVRVDNGEALIIIGAVMDLLDHPETTSRQTDRQKRIEKAITEIRELEASDGHEITLQQPKYNSKGERVVDENGVGVTEPHTQVLTGDALQKHIDAKKKSLKEHFGIEL